MKTQTTSEKTPPSPTPLNPWFDTLRARAWGDIQGKFHSHVTVALKDEGALTRLQQFCRARQIKVTVIELSDFAGRHQQDIMTTQHYRIPSKTAVAQIIDQLEALCAALKTEDFQVIRVKLEHESLPTLPVFTGTNYREAHIKLRLDPDRYDANMDWLRDQADAWGYVPSRNPLAVSRGKVIQFVNMRLYAGSLADTDQQIDAVADHLRAAGFDVAEVKRETTVFDSNLALDRWWA